MSWRKMMCRQLMGRRKEESPALKRRWQTIGESQQELLRLAMDQKIAQLEKSKSEKTEQLVAATAGKMARAKYGHHLW